MFHPETQPEGDRGGAEVNHSLNTGIVQLQWHILMSTRGLQYIGHLITHLAYENDLF